MNRRVQLFLALGLVAAAPLGGRWVFGDDAQLPATAPAGQASADQAAGDQGLAAGWEEVDQRMVFLTVELSSVENSIAAIDKAIVVTGYQQSQKQGAADQYRYGNERMDRQGGGPVPWQDFYGRTAQHFFYHPVDGDTVYINPRPVSQRPPQLDYIYRANSQDAQRAEADAAKLGNKIDQLLARRQALEAQQSALWCKITFRGIASEDLEDEPMYRFNPRPSGSDDRAHQQAAAVSAASDFMRAVNDLADATQQSVDQDQGQSYQQFQAGIHAARQQLMNRLLALPLIATDIADQHALPGIFSRAAKRMDDSSQNLSDAYGLAADGEKAGDDQRVWSFRGESQQMLIEREYFIAGEDVASAAVRPGRDRQRAGQNRSGAYDRDRPGGLHAGYFFCVNAASV